MKMFFRWIGQAFEEMAQWLGWLVHKIPLKYRVRVMLLDRKLETIFCRTVAVIVLLFVPILGLIAVLIGALAVFFITLLHMIRSHWQNRNKGGSDG